MNNDAGWGFIEVGEVKCFCGCGLEATEIYKGALIHGTNPMTHYKNYCNKIRRMEREVGTRESSISPLESA